MWVAENKRLVERYEELTQRTLPTAVVDPDGSKQYEGYELLLLLWETEEWLELFAVKPIACAFAVGCQRDGRFAPITEAGGEDIAIVRLQKRTDEAELEAAVLALLAEEGAARFEDISKRVDAGEQELQQKLAEMVRQGKLRRFKAGDEVFYEEGGD